MNIVLISYELLNPASAKKPKQVTEAIKEVTGWWWHHLPNIWLVAGDDLTVEKVYETIAQHFVLEEGSDPSDSLFIVEIVPEATQGYMPANAWEWIEKAAKRKPSPAPTTATG